MQKHRHLALKRTETVQNEKRLLGPPLHPAQSSVGRKQAGKITYLQTENTLYGKGMIIQRAKPRAVEDGS